MEELTLTHRRLPGTTVVTVGGELDAATARDLEAFLSEVLHEGDDLVFDLTALAFMDTSGLGVILAAGERTRRLGGRPCLAGLRGGPARVVALTGIASAVPVYDTVDDALVTATGVAAMAAS
ncbi:STAS domain-containing protein [Actinoallomurus soli]|uniref:STAS domain-containing protein n=1 Tax=Actinoallomurus soli TaxID=2952535 RepID=UPI002093B0D3|nr:STAS domain-containing protein [Actinoallomurus soli]MCO5969238.1 STAS domain-containing protein [Actinoallomurus soli]